MKKVTNFGLTLFAILLFISCNKTTTKYEVLKEEKKETSGKALLIEYVVYNDTVYKEETLKNIVLEVYEKNKNKDLFDNFDAPTVVNVYLFTSVEAANDKSEWICMLSKSLTSTEPTISFNNLKMNSLSGLNDNIKDESEIAYENLKKYLNDRNLDLCSFYKELGRMELESIHTADAKYPDFGAKHTEYVESIRKAEREKLIQKYNLNDSIFGQVTTYGIAYCK
ncbi:hypothetical protein [Flavobacterium sp.]|uniref:hypothetical protein n=1 Tax=Flavobacterium sp. TaxID=239 RepID=UPI00286E600F|nr:hypothetical protein [Flavobacterium sp.]